MTHNRRYRILKDTPVDKAGTEYRKTIQPGGEDYYIPSETGSETTAADGRIYLASTVENNPEWFEPIPQGEDKNGRIEVVVSGASWQKDKAGMLVVNLQESCITEDKFPLIKQAIEAILNNEQEDVKLRQGGYVVGIDTFRGDFEFADDTQKAVVFKRNKENGKFVVYYDGRPEQDHDKGVYEMLRHYQGEQSKTQNPSLKDCVTKSYVDHFPPYPNTSEQSKEWEIVEFLVTIGQHKYLYKKRDDGQFKQDAYVNIAGYLESDFNSKDEKIHSVKRLSDGEVFTIGELLLHKDGDYETKITGFVPDHIGWFYFEEDKSHVRDLKNFIKFDSSTTAQQPQDRKVLFTTEDGVDIFKGGEVWYVVIPENTWRIYHQKIYPHTTSLPYADGYKTFSTKEKAEEYVKENKPQYSLEDFRQIIRRVRESAMGSDVKHFINYELKQLAKSKIN